MDLKYMGKEEDCKNNLVREEEKTKIIAQIKKLRKEFLRQVLWLYT